MNVNYINFHTCYLNHDIQKIGFKQGIWTSETFLEYVLDDWEPPQIPPHTVRLFFCWFKCESHPKSNIDRLLPRPEVQVPHCCFHKNNIQAQVMRKIKPQAYKCWELVWYWEELCKSLLLLLLTAEDSKLQTVGSTVMIFDYTINICYILWAIRLLK